MRKYKVLIALAIVVVVLGGLIGFLVWWFKFRNIGSKFYQKDLLYKDPFNRTLLKGSLELDEMNPMWNFNPDFALDIDWSSINTLTEYREAIEKHRVTPQLINWNDKIFINNWLREHGFYGPEDIFSSYSVDRIQHIIPSLNEYCIKPSHLSEGYGVVVVKNSILQRNLKLPKGVDGSYPSKKGDRISVSHIHRLMRELQDVKATWTDKFIQSVRPGIIIEEIRENPEEFRVMVALGKEAGSFLNPHDPIPPHLARRLSQLAEEVTCISGHDLVRVDFFWRNDGRMGIGEMTWNPNEWRKDSPYLSFIDVPLCENVIRWHRQNETSTAKYFTPHPSWSLSPVFDLDIWSGVSSYGDYHDILTKIKEPSPDLVNFNDKIWLEKWLKSNNMPAAEIIFKSHNIGELERFLKGQELKSFCIKPSHLSESEGVIVVENGKLRCNTNINYIKKQHKTSIPKCFNKLVKGYNVSVAELVEAMTFLHGITASWEDEAQKRVIPGVVIENLRPTRKEYKIFVALGRIVGYYQHGEGGETEAFRKGAFELAQVAASDSRHRLRQGRYLLER